MPSRRIAPGAPVLRGAGVLAALLVALQPAVAGPLIPAGNAALRADIALLADHGIVTGPVTTWPLAWAPILADLREVDGDTPVPRHVRRAAERVLAAARRETGRGEARFSAALAGAAEPSRIRSFSGMPRESAEAGAGFDWTGDRLTVELSAQVVASPDDGEALRADGSLVGAALGNFIVAASTLDRWWGPGWDGSLVLSNNARPIPALTIDRTGTDAFDTRWLSWIGPWDLSVMMGRMESGRVVPDALFFGLRFTARPLPSLEIGLTRTAQWCGEGRPCRFSTFVDLLAGRDNTGDDGIGADNEPGNQLAGVDLRWSLAPLGLPLALYGQFIGEDEAGGFPSRYLAQAGVEGAGAGGVHWSYRWFAEMTDTSCGFYESDDNFNCAYNHGIYQTGYRYRGRAVGHGADNDARLLSLGLVLMDAAATRWNLLARYGELNRGGARDPRHSLTPVPRDLASLDVAWSRDFRFGVIELGAGAEHTRDTDLRAHLQWHTPR